MVLQQEQEFSTMQEMLDSLAECAILPEKSFPVKYEANGENLTSYVGSEPLKSSREFSFGDDDFVDGGGVVVNFVLPEEVYLDKRIEKLTGRRIRHGILQEQTVAAWSEKTRPYRNNVLLPYVVWTGQVGRKLAQGYEFRRVEDSRFEKIPKDITGPLVEIDGKLIETADQKMEEVLRMKLSSKVFQTALDSEIKAGYYSQFKGEIPVCSEVSPNSVGSRGNFRGIRPDERGLFAVRCDWYYGGLSLYAGEDKPLDGLVDRVLGVFEDENPKK